MHPVRIGCSGWSYDDWRGDLYPDGLPQRRWLERYAEVFETVEVNATFYRLPKESTVRAWVEQVPGDFLFAVKASRYLTHMKRLHDVADAVARFWEPLEPLRQGGRLGPVLWQLPESFHRDDDLLATALEQLPRARHCFEFRHPSWFATPVRELLEERGASLAIGDDKRRSLPDARPSGAIAYLRLHYGHRGRGGNYSEAELASWRRRIAAWRSRRPVFVRLPKQRLEGLCARQRPLPEAGLVGEQRGVAGTWPPRRTAPLSSFPPASRSPSYVAPPTSAAAAAVEGRDANGHFKWRARGKRRLHQTPRAGEVEACRPWLEAELKAARTPSPA